MTDAESRGAKASTSVPAVVLLRTIARIVAVVGILLGAYWFIPVHPESAAVTAAAWAAALAVTILGLFFIRQTGRIFRSEYPMLAAVETLAILLGVFVIGFAFVYLALATSETVAFSEPLNRTGALYFAVTVLSTVGFGDITPISDGARWLVMIQMLIDIGLLAGALRLVVGIARRADRRQRGQD
ncbi:MAG: two pore domain potassium channel family protein [Actinobacteria bacterium]|nr:two pore domain potassium channel family protein [Actinomycetota bacterium]